MTGRIIQDETLDMALETEEGYRAVCLDEECRSDLIAWYPWWGMWRARWFDAHLDAYIHNHEEHGGEDVVWIRSQSDGADPLLPLDLEQLPWLHRAGGLLRRSVGRAAGQLLQALRRA